MSAKQFGHHTILPNPDLVLQCPPGVALTTEEETLLRIMFASYETVAVDVEYRSGYSGSRTFLILPIKADGRADAYTVVKIGPQPPFPSKWPLRQQRGGSSLPRPLHHRLKLLLDPLASYGVLLGSPLSGCWSLP